MNKKFEIRSTSNQPKAEKESRTISGYAITFEQESRVLSDWGDGGFIEIISRDAVSEDLINSSDIRCLFNHDRNAILARSINGKGTLKLTIDKVGLRYEFEAPNSTVGNDLLESVRRGDIFGSSFAFRTYSEGAVDYYYEKRKDGSKQAYRRVNKIDELHDVSPVVDPAYLSTSVEARAWDVANKPQATPEPHQSVAEREYRNNLLKLYKLKNRL